MNGSEQKKIIFSGVQPSGNLTIGNYLGALKNWVDLQYDYRCAFCVVDLHAITVRQDPKELRKASLEVLGLYMACGIDPDVNLLFFQSHVPAHAELAWVLNCYTYMGELSRMTQFKEKSQRHEENINTGLFTYPVLMASDILLYQTDLVPVGEDQKQHLEISRDIAIRFNRIYGETFRVPEVYIPKVGARVMSLQEPEKKMSKSDDNENNFVAILDAPDTILRKFKRAVTDSLNVVRFSDDQPGIKNLISIYSATTGRTIAEVEAEFEGKGYGEFKTKVGESVVECLRPVQEKFHDLMKNKDYIESVYKTGAEKAQSIASRTLAKVYKRVGFIPR